MLEVYLKELAKASSLLDEITDAKLIETVSTMKDTLVKLNERLVSRSDAQLCYLELMRQVSRVEDVLRQRRIVSCIEEMLDENDGEWKFVVTEMKALGVTLG